MKDHFSFSAQAATISVFAVHAKARDFILFFFILFYMQRLCLLAFVLVKVLVAAPYRKQGALPDATIFSKLAGHANALRMLVVV